MYKSTQDSSGSGSVISRMTQNEGGKYVHGVMLKDNTISVCVCMRACVHARMYIKDFQTRNIHVKVFLYLQENLPDTEPD
jgi:hypothetical protein